MMKAKGLFPPFIYILALWFPVQTLLHDNPVAAGVPELKYEVHSRYEPKTDQLVESMAFDFSPANLSPIRLVFYRPVLMEPYGVEFVLDSSSVDGVPVRAELSEKNIKLILDKPLKMGSKHKVELNYCLKSVSKSGGLLKSPLTAFLLPKGGKEKLEEVVFSTLFLFPYFLRYDDTGTEHSQGQKMERTADFQAWITLPDTLRVLMRTQAVSEQSNKDRTSTYLYQIKGEKMFYWMASRKRD